MSTDASGGEAAHPAKDGADVCAACGKGGVGLKKCSACKMVKYCGRECQQLHRRKHKKSCKHRASLLHEEALFQPCPPRDDCPICFVPLPFEDYTNMPCCGQTICTACFCLVVDKACALCRAPPFSTVEGLNDRYRQRAEAGDPQALYQLADNYRGGLWGFRQDPEKAQEMYLKGAEDGDIPCHSAAGSYYLETDGDLKRARHHLERAAMAGDVRARNNLGAMEYRAGDERRAAKHYLISANAGYTPSLNAVKDCYVDGDVSKEEFEMALRGHKESADAMRSPQRDRTIEMFSMHSHLFPNINFDRRT